MRELAHLSGVSIATVSRALNHDERVSEATRDRVLSVARSSGYRVNRAARRLKSGQTRVIGFVLERSVRSDSFARQLLLGLTDALAERDYHLVVKAADASDPMRAVHYFADPQVADGVVLTHTQPRDPRAEWLVGQGTPCISHGQTGFAHDWVDFDNRRFAQLASEKLRQQGRDRQALIAPPAGLNYAQLLKQAFRACAGPDGRIIDVDSSQAPEQIYQAILAVGCQFDGWILPDESLLMPALAALRGLGLAPGRDVEIVVKKFSSQVDFAGVPLWVCEESLYAAGLQMGQQVLQRIEMPSADPRQHLIAPEIHYRSMHDGI